MNFGIYWSFFDNAVYRVHGKVMKEHKIDSAVLKSMHKERKITLPGIVLIIVGFVVRWLI